jgi:hypothetical protein
MVTTAFSPHNTTRQRCFTTTIVTTLMIWGFATAPASARGVVSNRLYMGSGLVKPAFGHVSAGTMSTLVPKAPPVQKPSRYVNAGHATVVREQSATPRTPAAVNETIQGFDETDTGHRPPDTTVGASDSRLLEAVNTSVRLYMKDPPIELDTKTFTSFLGLPSGTYTTDPRVFYDANATNPRMLVTIEQKGGTSDATGVSRVWLAVSRSPNPSTLGASDWCRYPVNTKIFAGTSQSSFADFPMLGVGSDSIIVTANDYTWPNPGPSTFSYSIVRVFNKTIAENNATSCPSLPTYRFRGSANFGDTNAMSLSPEQAYVGATPSPGVQNPAYLVSTEASPSSIYRVWRIDGVTSGSVRFSFLRISGGSSLTYRIPPNAPQPGTTKRLDTGDQRVEQVAGYADDLWVVHGTLCQFTSGTSFESCVRRVHLTVGATGTGAISATIANAETFGGGDNRYYWAPGVAVNGTETAIPFQLTNPSGYLSVRFVVENNDVRPPSVLLANGTCTDTFDFDPNFGSVRTGDYVGAQTDPTNSSVFWIAGERATALSGTCQWQTFIGEIS